MARTRQVVFTFSEGDESTRNPRIRGGKGASLALLAAAGLPVPPGFTITTTVGRAWLQEGTFPKRLDWQLQRGLDEIAKRTGTEFGNPDNPLLVSVRSGARTSMPGMMDTVLNVGISGQVFKTLVDTDGKNFAKECKGRLNEGLGRKISNPHDQLVTAIREVLTSWNSKRAFAYRNLHDIPHWEGTAVNVQAMVFGNADDNSCTGVAFSHNPDTAEVELYGEFLTRSQGEDLVSGKTTPVPLVELEVWNGEIYTELQDHVNTIRELYDDMVEVEFTVERGKLWILQARVSKGTPVAAATFAVHKVWDKRWDKTRAVSRISSSDVTRLNRTSLVTDDAKKAWHGTPASAGAGVGRLVFSADEAEKLAALGEDVVLARQFTTPEDLSGMIAAKAIVTEIGGATCHAAVVARSLGIPAVVGLEGFSGLSRSKEVSVDGTSGAVYQGVLPMVHSESSKEIDIFLRWYKKYGLGMPKLNFSLLNQSFSAFDLIGDFYLTDSIAGEAAGSELEFRALELRNEVHVNIAEILACYLTVAVAGEVRHGASDERSTSPEVIAMRKELHDTFGVPYAFDRANSQISVVDRLRGVEISDQIRFFELSADYFVDGFSGGAFGGERWRKIALAAKNYLDGTFPISVFVDHAFDLRHNGNRLFDKHSMVTERLSWIRRLNLEGLLGKKNTAKGPVEMFNQFRESVKLSESVQALFNAGVEKGVW